MTTDITLFLLVIILFLCFILPLTSNYMTFIKLYFTQVLSILLLFFFMHGETMWHDMILLSSFLMAIVVRLIGIPRIMSRFIQKGQFPLVERKMMLGTVTTILVMLVGILAIYQLTLKLFGAIDVLFMTSMFTLFSWFLVAINHTKVIWNVLWFLLLENVLFLISVALSDNITIYIELGVLIDVVMSIWVFVIAIVKINQVHNSIAIQKLTLLRD